MSRSLIAGLLVAAAAMALVWQDAHAGLWCDQFGCCCSCCLKCGRACHVEVKPGKEKRICWEVECEAVCIPAVRFPWQKCHPPRCGRSRTIRVMAPKEYDVDICEYDWIAPELCPDCRKKEQAKDKGELKSTEPKVRGPKSQEPKRRESKPKQELPLPPPPPRSDAEEPSENPEPAVHSLRFGGTRRFTR